MDFQQGPQRRVAAPVLGIDRIAPAAPRRVMAIEERGADELHGDGLGEHAVFRPLPVGDEPPQVRPRLPIRAPQLPLRDLGHDAGIGWAVDRKSTRLNSSHGYISYAVFCLKKKK